MVKKTKKGYINEFDWIQDDQKDIIRGMAKISMTERKKGKLTKKQKDEFDKLNKRGKKNEKRISAIMKIIASGNYKK